MEKWLTSKDGGGRKLRVINVRNTLAHTALYWKGKQWSDAEERKSWQDSGLHVHQIHEREGQVGGERESYKVSIHHLLLCLCERMGKARTRGEQER